MTRPAEPRPRSVWLRGIRRAWCVSGDLRRWIEDAELAGGTFDWDRFAKDIVDTQAYWPDVRPMAQAGWAAERIVEELAVHDVRAAADVFLPTFEATGGERGFVSVGIPPGSSASPDESLPVIRAIWSSLNRPNGLVQIPAAAAGTVVIGQAVAEGISVEAIDVFSLDRLADALEAFLRGLELRVERGESLGHVVAILSMPLRLLESRIDQQLRDLVGRAGTAGGRAEALLGRAAVALGRIANAHVQAVVAGDRFRALAERGARPPRLVCALAQPFPSETPIAGYLLPLAGAGIAIEVMPETLPSLGGREKEEGGEEEDFSVSRAHLHALEALGVGLDALAVELEVQQRAALSERYSRLVEAVRGRSARMTHEIGGLCPGLMDTLAALDREEVGRRLWQEDASLWADRPSEVSEARQRLGWLHLPQTAGSLIAEAEAFRDEIRTDGIRTVVLLGMGGSSLAPDVAHRMLASDKGCHLLVLDSIDPGTVAGIRAELKVEDTLFVVSSKSGTTTEPLALLEYFWFEAHARLGEFAGSRFAAITDPGTALEVLARERRFRKVFAGPPDVGGRYSALSAFGLVPAALAGVDVRALVQGGLQMATACGPHAGAVRNPGSFLGATLAAAAAGGRDKVTFLSDPGWEPLEDWIEQLIAESTGKSGKGLLPVVGEPPGPARLYPYPDRLMVYLRRSGDHDRRVQEWTRAGIPVIVLEVGEGALGLGAEFFRWEVAVAVACHLIGVHAFNQPDVQRTKDRTVELLKAFRKKGALPAPPVLWRGEWLTLWGEEPRDALPRLDRLQDVPGWLMAQIVTRESLALLAYLRRNEAVEAEIHRLRRIVRDRTGAATTAGFGPRYLHSTGQLHKGGPDRIVFLLITAEPASDLSVPAAGYTFGVLERAQALGDLQALVALGRRAYGLHLDDASRLRDVVEAFDEALRRRRSRDGPSLTDA